MKHNNAASRELISETQFVRLDCCENSSLSRFVELRPTSEDFRVASSRRADQRGAVYSAKVTCTETKPGNCRPAERRSFTVKEWPSEIETAVEGARKKVEGRRGISARSVSAWSVRLLTGRGSARTDGVTSH